MTKALSLLALIVLSVAGVCGVAVLGYNTFVMPTTDRGTCLIIDANQCSALSLARVAGVLSDADVTLPPGTTVVDSGSSRNLKAGELFALLRLGRDSFVKPGAGYELRAGAGAASRAVARLERSGSVTAFGVWSRGLEPLAIAVGRDADGVQWAYVVATWNG